MGSVPRGWASLYLKCVGLYMGVCGLVPGDRWGCTLVYVGLYLGVCGFVPEVCALYLGCVWVCT